jgi:hypothetical protein
LVIIGIFVFICGGYVGKYFYYIGHTDFYGEDGLWIWRHGSQFFSWDGLFIFWGMVFVLIYIVIIALVVVLLKGVKRGICCVVKSPYHGVKYLTSKKNKKGDEQTDPIAKKKKKKKKKTRDEDV